MTIRHYLSQLFHARQPRAIRRGSKKTAAPRLRLERFEDRCLPAVFMVTNTNDGGPGSLRQAIFDAEFTPNVGGPDRIEFNIPGSGVHTIFPTSTYGLVDSLTHIIDPVIIDGYTQPGASPNTLAVGDNAVLKIEINGSLLPGTNVFQFSGTNSTVRGLAINQYPASAFALGPFGFLHGNNNTFTGNFIGTDAAGLTVQVQGDSRAIEIIAGSGNVFGGPTPADRNLITSPREMFGFQTGSGNVIQGNYLGVSKDGTAPLQPPSGTFAIVIRAESGSNTIADNVILGTDTSIALLEGTTGNNLIQGNFIGTNATSTASLGGGTGISDQGTSDRIIGNVISGGSFGILINHQGLPGPGPTIQGNTIGTDVTGTLPLPNGGDGIFIMGSADGATIGGTNPGDGNTIAFSGRHGVFVNTGNQVSILGNSIFANGNIGINLNGGLDGFFGPVTANDPGDVDTGPNGLQNFPVLTSASTGGGSTGVAGTLNSTANTTFRLEFFANGAADPSGFGQGQTFLGFTNVTTDAGGNATFNVTLANVGGSIISATATDPAGNTSEFAEDFTATNGDVIIDATTTQAFLNSLTVIHGNLIMVGVAGRTDLILPNLTEVDGDFIVTGNPDLTVLDAPVLDTVGGKLVVRDNPALTDINMRNVTTVGGDLIVVNNVSATNIIFGSLVTVGGHAFGGSVSISNNTGATGIDLSTLTTVSGSVSISNSAATSIDLSTLRSVGGSVSISNSAATSIDLSTLTSVGGDETVQAQNSVTAVTADGSTAVNLFTADAQMTAALGRGTFTHPVAFTVTRLDPAALPPEPGQDAAGGAATIDPLAAYQFHFAIPTLGQNASLSFEINLAALSPAERTAFLAALSLGNATVAVKNDAVGSVFRAFAIAAPGQPPDASHVTVVRLDANHTPLPAGSTATPAFVRFEGITGHFSSFAVVTVSGTGNNAPVVASLNGPAVGVRGQALHYSGAFTDPDADTWTGTVNFGDGSGDYPLALNPDKTFAFDHVFPSTGTYNVVVKVADKHGGVGARSLAVSVVAAVQESDPLDPAHSMLVVGGTTGADTIVFSPIGNAGGIRVTINGIAVGDFTPTGRLVAFGQAGDDDIQVAGGIANSAWLFGGAGNDRLKGGAGDDVLIGGAGDDLLVGGNGRDLMIGGQGADRLVGDAGDDILIAGFTAFDADQFALHGIQTEWTSARSYAARVANIQGTGTGPRANGNIFLLTDGPSATAFDDAAEDVLTGSAGADWFFANLDAGVRDKITDLSAGEFANDLDFIGP